MFLARGAIQSSRTTPTTRRISEPFLPGYAPVWPWRHLDFFLMLVKHQRAQFDALARRRVCRRRRIDERRMRPKSRPAVGGRIVALQKQSFIGRHFREIEPAMVGIVFYGIGFAAPVRID